MKVLVGQGRKKWVMFRGPTMSLGHALTSFSFPSFLCGCHGKQLWIRKA